MSSDRRLSHAIESIRKQLIDTDSFTTTRKGITDIWRQATAFWLAKDWLARDWETDPPADPHKGKVNDLDVIAEIMATQKVRMSKGRLMQLRLALEDNGIDCEPALERLDSMQTPVRLYRKWRTEAAS